MSHHKIFFSPDGVARVMNGAIIKPAEEDKSEKKLKKINVTRGEVTQLEAIASRDARSLLSNQPRPSA